ncbi:MAG TPA: HEAT repeat domain-containing protein [Terriglobales bacterium]|nr:HEAT repeat domain-containing protein [Terriglobales bacterium]
MQKWTLRDIKNMPINLAISALLLAVVSVPCIANGQQAPTQSQGSPSTADAISNVEKGNFSSVDIAIIVRRHAVQAIPSLETQFNRSKDPTTKERIADALIRLGEKNAPYWDYVINRARQVLGDAPPTPIEYDASGTVASTEPSKRLIEWANKHHISIQQAWYDAMFDAPGAIKVLGIYDDARAIPILREALISENDFIKIAAAQGLAELHDTASIPTIIKVCQNAPKEAASSIAQSLIYFDDPAAQRAVDVYVPANTAQELRKARAHGKTPFR